MTTVEKRHRWCGVAVILVLAGLASPAAANPGIGTMYNGIVESGTAIGAGLWQGASSGSVPGTPTPGAGCAPAVQQAHGAGYAAGMRNVTTISQSERQPPGKLLTTCITTLIDMMATFDIFSNLSQWSFQTLLSKVEQYAAQLVCDEVAQEWTQVVSKAFNSMAFLNEIVPCGIAISLPSLSASGGSLNFCSSIGGPLATVGTTGGTLYTIGSGQPIPPILSGSLGGSDALSILGR